MKREVTAVLGTTTVDVSASVTTMDGRTLLDSRIHGRVRFFGENLGVANDLAKHIAKLLRTGELDRRVASLGETQRMNERPANSWTLH